MFFVFFFCTVLVISKGVVQKVFLRTIELYKQGPMSFLCCIELFVPYCIPCYSPVLDPPVIVRTCPDHAQFFKLTK